MAPLSDRDRKAIHENVLGVLKDVGAYIGHARLLDALEGIGAEIDRTHMTARFRPELVEEFLHACRRQGNRARKPALWGRAAMFHGKYHDPDTGELGPVNEERMREYFTLAKALPNVTSYFIAGCQWPVKPEAEPLYERFHAWKYGLDCSGILYPLSTSENLLELCETYAAIKGKNARDVCAGGVFMQSPLRLSDIEAAQFVWWWERGFNVGLAHMTTAGLSAPVTLPGLVVVNLAEHIALALLRKACYGAESLSITAMLSGADMRTMMRPYGRPELALANGMIADMAEFYGVDCFAQSGLTDAKLPSEEAGAQKAMTTLYTLMRGASTLMDCGTLAVDEVFSPIQMILDNELTGAMGCLLKQQVVDEETIAADVIREVGHDGLHAATTHTAKHFRSCLWEPGVWSREMLSAWEAGGGKTDADKAREMYHQIMSEAPDPTVLAPDEQEALLEVIRRVESS